MLEVLPLGAAVLRPFVALAGLVPVRALGLLSGFLFCRTWKIVPPKPRNVKNNL